MPRGEKATYLSASKSFKAFLYRRSPDAREAHLERFVSEVKGMGTPGTGKKRKSPSTDGAAAPSAPAPTKVTRAKAKKKATKKAKKKAAPAEVEEEDETGDEDGGEEAGAEA